VIQRLRTVRVGRGERGYSLIESLIVMAILATVMGGIGGLFVSGSRAEIDANRRFEAQQNGRLSLDRIRRDIHCARSAAVSTVAGSPTTYKVTLTIPTGCGGDISWCTVHIGGSSTRFGLYRQAGSACGSNGLKVADFLTSANAFPTYTAQSMSSLASLLVDIKVSLRGSSNLDAYELTDTIYLRNSTRT
jgi:prepilin-type N-terminal cleavage/methylation domain-containing protein